MQRNNGGEHVASGRVPPMRVRPCAASVRPRARAAGLRAPPTGGTPAPALHSSAALGGAGPPASAGQCPPRGPPSP